MRSGDDDERPIFTYRAVCSVDGQPSRRTVVSSMITTWNLDQDTVQDIYKLRWYMVPVAGEFQVLLGRALPVVLRRKLGVSERDKERGCVGNDYVGCERE